MPQANASHIALAEDLCSRATIPFTAGLALKVAYLVLVWKERKQARTILRHMEKHRREDIGLSLEQVYLEARKPFWRR
ncbi:DUF1127 domain-containing protein [Neptunicoccus cionae]|mgnify:CR=1 FL=1|uniref:DUF1127 domain-containing protein n=1 Tax=Neptunicoccus cionae TaxID=2035344 RepID=A0A916VLV5_9RHOB|nr:hypothetical protein [Amylibacter cionae]GGA05202.1 hypothetical protein GCM10011498_00850 [Amylibacter cionae]